MKNYLGLLLRRSANSRKKRQAYSDFRNEFKEFERQLKGRMEINWNDVFPILHERTSETDFDAHYVYHPAWATRIIKQINPKLHIDISSTLHFSAQLSAFFKIEFYDFRPANLHLDNLNCGRADLTNLFFQTNSIESLSCMHTVEHIGLGRYGDPIDANGDLKAIAELKRVVKPGGSLLFVVPVGKEKIVFNAHRIYNANKIVELFSGFSLRNFTLINDKGSYIENAEFGISDLQNYGCGCFWFQKNGEK